MPPPVDSDAEFRDFAARVRPSVDVLYRQHHAGQTVEFARARKAAFLPPRRQCMGVWEGAEIFDPLADDSDPDLALPQLDHALQTAETLRADGAEPWRVSTGFLRDSSCYVIHREGACDFLLSPRDRETLAWVRHFHRYDLSSKSREPADRERLLPCSREFVAASLSPVLSG